MTETIKHNPETGAVTITADDGAQREWTLAEWEEDSTRCIAATGNGFLRGVPDQITAPQARVVLHRAGLLTRVNEMMAAPETPEEVKIFWEYEPNLNRNSPALNAMAVALGLTQAQLDDMFRSAAGIAV